MESNADETEEVGSGNEIDGMPELEAAVIEPSVEEEEDEEEDEGQGEKILVNNDVEDSETTVENLNPDDEEESNGGVAMEEGDVDAEEVEKEAVDEEDVEEADEEGEIVEHPVDIIPLDEEEEGNEMEEEEEVVKDDGEENEVVEDPLDENTDSKLQEDSHGSEEESKLFEGNPKMNKDLTDDDDSKSSDMAVVEEAVITRKRSASISSREEGPKRKQGRSASNESSERNPEGTPDQQHDAFCWVCHKEGIYFQCKICPRSFHMKCLPDYPQQTVINAGEIAKCICPECVIVMNAEEIATRSEAMKQVTMDQLVDMLKQICGRMKATPGSDPFLKPVQPSDAHDYFEYIVNPMDIQTLEENVQQRHYGSTEAFLADAQWIVHNSSVFNSPASPYTAAAKRILKVCKQELGEIETCPECYTNAHIKSDTWFVEACKRPHILVWAKLKGFPFWPAKAMKIKDDQVDVRFFGQHDRAWVFLKDCYFYSEEMPVTPPKKNLSLQAAIEELNTHVERLAEMYGEVTFAEVKTPLGRELSTVEIQKMLPEYEPFKMVPKVSAASENSDKNPVENAPVTLTISSLKSNPVVVLNKPECSPVATAAAADKKVIKTKRMSTNTTADIPSATAVVVKKPSKSIVPVRNDASEIAKTIETIPVPETPPVVKEKSSITAKELDDDFEARVPNGEILANALGLKRINRRGSESNGSLTPSREKTSSQESVSPHDSRSLRSSITKSVGEADTETLPASSPILQQQLRKASKLSARSESPLVPAVVIKTEPTDAEDSEEMDLSDSDEALVGTKLRKTHDFMEQISTQAQTKPGMRFNISKDISISAISKDDMGDDGKESPITGHRMKKTFTMSPSISVNPAHGREPTGVSQKHSNSNLQARPRFAPQQPQSLTRFLNSSNDVKSFARLLKPALGNTGGKLPTVQTIAPRPRAVPGAIQMSKMRGGTGSILQKLAKDGNIVQKSSPSTQNNPGSQGAITLPGGTITVTPLSSQGANAGMNGGDRATVSNVSQKSVSQATTNGMPVSILEAVASTAGHSSTSGSSKSSKAPNSLGPTSRKVTSMVPVTVVHTVQNLQKNVSEMIRQAAESIAVDMVEHTAVKNDGDKNSKLEIEKLSMRHTKELTDMRLNHDLMMRELRSNMDAEKKRAMSDLRRILEIEKQKAVDEAKRKQWCANCLREALFYCCWNTSYCGYTCQENHWPTHMATCTQSTGGAGNSKMQ